MRGTLRDTAVQSKLSPDDKRRLQESVDGALHWLESNQLAEKEEFEDKMREVEGVCQPVITAMHQQARGKQGRNECLL